MGVRRDGDSCRGQGDAANTLMVVLPPRVSVCVGSKSLTPLQITWSCSIAAWDSYGPFCWPLSQTQKVGRSEESEVFVEKLPGGSTGGANFYYRWTGSYLFTLTHGSLLVLLSIVVFTR
jgi:hypothetical protein